MRRGTYARRGEDAVVLLCRGPFSLSPAPGYIVSRLCLSRFYCNVLKASADLQLVLNLFH